MAQRAFSVRQAYLGSPLQWQPAMGSVELDVLIDEFIPGPYPLDQKRAQVTLQFLNSFDDSLLASGPVTRRFQLASNNHVTNVASVAAKIAGTKRAREESTATTSSKRMPGFSILTKDGVDITEYASRGPKTKEQRDHAALMRKLKACDKCKRSKQRCDPSHHGISASPASSSAATSPSSAVTRPTYFTSSTGSRSSISPQSLLENSFDSYASSTKRLSPTQSPATSFSTSDFAESPQANKEVLASIEARRQALLQQQAELDAELAALQSSQYPVTSNFYQSQSSFSSPSFHSDVQQFDSAFDVNGNWLENFDSQLNAYNDFTPSVAQTRQQSSSDVIQNVTPHIDPIARPGGSGTLASPSCRRLASPEPDFDLSTFLNDAAFKNVPVIDSGENASPVECHGDSPFDHNYRPEGLERDFVLFPTGSVSQWSIDSLRESRTGFERSAVQLVQQDAGSPRSNVEKSPGLEPDLFNDQLDNTNSQHSGASTHLNGLYGNFQQEVGGSLLTWGDELQLSSMPVRERSRYVDRADSAASHRIVSSASSPEVVFTTVSSRPQPLRLSDDTTVPFGTVGSNEVVNRQSELRNTVALQATVSQALGSSSESPDAGSAGLLSPQSTQFDRVRHIADNIAGPVDRKASGGRSPSSNLPQNSVSSLTLQQQDVVEATANGPQSNASDTMAFSQGVVAATATYSSGLQPVSPQKQLIASSNSEPQVQSSDVVSLSSCSGFDSQLSARSLTTLGLMTLNQFVLALTAISYLSCHITSHLDERFGYLSSFQLLSAIAVLGSSLVYGHLSIDSCWFSHGLLNNPIDHVKSKIQNYFSSTDDNYVNTVSTPVQSTSTSLPSISQSLRRYIQLGAQSSSIYRSVMI